MMLPKNREPTEPSEMLRLAFLEPAGMTQQELAEKMKVTVPDGESDQVVLAIFIAPMSDAHVGVEIYLGYR
jgi:hypothetical protein